ncbi:MAG TPA: hypothetical protein ENN38_06395 [Actinobacteria bacterium]|nr:hypothetical protein [Actinomycetota bacterium]
MCAEQKPIVDELEKKYEESINLRRVELTSAEWKTESEKYNVTSVPAFVFLTPDGELVEKIENLQEKATLESKIKDLL